MKIGRLEEMSIFFLNDDTASPREDMDQMCLSASNVALNNFFFVHSVLCHNIRFHPYLKILWRVLDGRPPQEKKAGLFVGKNDMLCAMNF